MRPWPIERGGSRDAYDISIVIAAHNGLPEIEHQLAALCSQHWSGSLEVVVVDNRSTDGTADAVRRWADRLPVLRVVPAEEGRGQGYARNVGIAAARGTYVCILDQDDVVGDGWLQAMGGAFLGGHELIAARLDLDRLNPPWVQTSRDIAQVRGLPQDPWPWAYGCTLGARRADLLAVGGFDPELTTAEDLDICLRLHRIGLDLHFVPDAVVHYRFRTGLRAIFEQGRRYGIGGVELHARYPDLLPPRPWSRVARGWLGAARLLIRSSQKSDRARAVYLLGNRFGFLEGSVRNRRMFL